MKNPYIKPTLKVVKIETSQMICLSGNLDNTQTITNENQFGARGFDFWEEEELGDDNSDSDDWDDEDWEDEY